MSQIARYLSVCQTLHAMLVFNITVAIYLLLCRTSQQDKE